MKIPVVVEECYKQMVGGTMKEAIDDSPFKGKVVWHGGGKMRMETAVFKKLFKPCCDQIVEYIETELQDPQVKDTNTFLMVGRVSESPILQDALQKVFPGKKIIIPGEADLAVLKGAVIFGHRL